MMLSSVENPIELTTDNCHTLPLECPITLYVPESGLEFGPASGPDAEALTPVTATAVQLTLIKGADTHALAGNLPKDCHLILSVSLAQYQQILEQALFHLKPEVRGPLQRADFLPDLPILLELGLQPHFFHSVGETDTEQTASLLTQLLAVLETPPPESEPKPELRASDFLRTLLGNLSSDPGMVAPWQKTDSWLCRSVQQRQADQTVGYATLWAYTTPEQTDPVIESGATALDAIASLLQKTTDAVKAEVEQDLPQIQQSLSQFSDELISALEQVDWETLLASDGSTDGTADSPEDSLPTISAVVRQFFDEDDWAYVQLSQPLFDPSILQLAFEGNAGRWTCLTQSNDAAAQIVFYSICPIIVPEANYGVISELLMRANDGLIIGNFELDFAQGEIRYRTSLDAEGDRFTPALMRRLVYTNVQTLDTYLPGILAVLAGDCSPRDAIASVEQAEDQQADTTGDSGSPSLELGGRG